jgi:hypothetical protein
LTHDFPFNDRVNRCQQPTELLLGSNCKAEQTEIQARLVQVSMKRSIGIHFCNSGFPSSCRQVCFQLLDLQVSHCGTQCPGTQQAIGFSASCHWGRPNRCCWEITKVKFPDEVFRWTSWDAILMILVRHCLIASYFIIMYHDIVSYLETIFQFVRIPWTNHDKPIQNGLWIVCVIFSDWSAVSDVSADFRMDFVYEQSSLPTIVLPRRIIRYNMIQSTLEKFWRECSWYTLVDYHWISHVYSFLASWHPPK